MKASHKKHYRSHRAGERAEHEFLDSSREWRRIFSECWGTFLLVVVAAGAHVVAAQSDGKVTLEMIVVAPGIMVMAIIYFMGTVSGAHLNPAVTLAFALRRNFPWRRVPCVYRKPHHHLFGWRNHLTSEQHGGTALLLSGRLSLALQIEEPA
jgi:hypothetical protein